MQLPNDYPEKLISVATEYLKEHEGSEIFSYESYTFNPYQDKSITSTTYRVYIIYGNLFEVMRYVVCSKPEWTYRDVNCDTMIAKEIDVCHKKYMDISGIK
jgi:hypothetical protein